VFIILSPDRISVMPAESLGSVRVWYDPHVDVLIQGWPIQERNILSQPQNARGDGLVAHNRGWAKPALTTLSRISVDVSCQILSKRRHVFILAEGRLFDAFMPLTLA
jgi:hypothetical protein